MNSRRRRERGPPPVIARKMIAPPMMIKTIANAERCRWPFERSFKPETVRAMLLRNLGRAADDPVGSHDMYDDDAVLEFPQSGERFEGVANIREWRSRYPGSVTYDIRRILTEMHAEMSARIG